MCFTQTPETDVSYYIYCNLAQTTLICKQLPLQFNYCQNIAPNRQVFFHSVSYALLQAAVTSPTVDGLINTATHPKLSTDHRGSNLGQPFSRAQPKGRWWLNFLKRNDKQTNVSGWILKESHPLLNWSASLVVERIVDKDN